jgi:type II secretory pathway component PulM
MDILGGLTGWMDFALNPGKMIMLGIGAILLLIVVYKILVD